MSSFAELKSVCPGLVDPDVVCEAAIDDEPLVVLEKLELMAERLIRTILAFEGLEEPADNTQISRLNLLSNRGFLPLLLLPFFHILNDADQTLNIAHSAAKMRATLLTRLLERLVIWFVKSYGPYLPPSATNAEDAEGVVNAIRENVPSDTIRRSARKVATRRAHTMRLNEEETRVIIDFQLKAAGWQVDTFALRYSQGARPEKGVSKAISEWQTETGPADYALFAGLDFIGFIEAKKMGKDVISDLKQSKRYARGAQLDGQARFMGGPWGEFHVPFLFSTNARPYLEQLKEKSGIWFLDARLPTNHPRPLQGWYSADELVALLNQDITAAHKKLAHEPMDYLGLRDYQEKAVKK